MERVFLPGRQLQRQRDPLHGHGSSPDRDTNRDRDVAEAATRQVFAPYD
jgi:hypothetical protein